MKKYLIFGLLSLFVSIIFANSESQSIFIENKGQVVDFNGVVKNDILFYFQSENLDIYFRKEGITYIFKKSDAIFDPSMLMPDQISQAMEEYGQKETYYYRLDMDFINSSSLCEAYGEGVNKTTSNYYFAHCPDGILGVRMFEKVVYHNVYDGIHFEFYLQNGQLKYDIIVEEGKNISDIGLKYESGNEITLNNNQIFIQSPIGEIRETIPQSSLIADNHSENIEVFYTLNNNIVGFSCDYQTENKLIIDPAITWTTYYDDSFWNGYNSSIDAKGNQVVVVAYGFSNNYPTLNPGSGAYFQNSGAGSGDYRIVKFDGDGVRIWSTYYGGTGYDHSPRVRIDYTGNIVVIGHTESTNIPTQNAGGYFDGTYNAGTYGGGTFIIRFNSSGVRNWATYYDYVHYPYLDIDLNNNIYILGRAQYNDPPVLSLAGAYNQATVSMNQSGSSKSQDMFILKFNSSTSRIWATNLGGNCGEYPQDIFCGRDGYINILGYGDNYYGVGIITANPGSGAYYDNTLGIGGPGGGASDRDDALIYRFTPGGAMFWGTAFSGTLNENMQQARITADTLNNIYICGETRSTDLPCVNPGSGAYFDNVFNASGSGFNPFLAKFSPGGVLNWCTYYGTYGLGYGMNMSSWVGINEDNNLIYVATDGGGAGGTFPLQPRAGDYNATLLVYMGVYVAEFNSNLGLAWSTYYAGSTDRNMLGDCSLTSDPCGYQLYMTSNWQKYDAAATDPPWEKPTLASYQNTIHSTADNGSGLLTRFGTISPDATITPVSPVCLNAASFNLSAASSGGTWSGNGITNPSAGTFDPSVAGAGTHTITYGIAGSCGDTATTTITVYALPPVTLNASSTSICIGDDVTLTAGGAANYTWSPSGSGSSYIASPSATTTWYITGTDGNNCSNTASITVTVSDPADATISPVLPFCIDVAPFNLSATDAGGTWSGNGITNSSAGTFSPSVAGAGTHTITYGIAGPCGDTATTTITVYALPSVTINASSISICNGDDVTLTAGGGCKLYLEPFWKRHHSLYVTNKLPLHPSTYHMVYYRN
jgi:hypothetical protein